MKLIIDIPEKVVTAIQNGEDYRYDIHTAIAQGIPYEKSSQGEWSHREEYTNNRPFYITECPFCKLRVQEETNFCPNCGVQLGGAE